MRAQRLFDDFRGNAPANGGRQDDGAAGAFDGCNDLLRNGKVHGWAHGVVPDRIALYQNDLDV
jgi:hypothetical protein